MPKVEPNKIANILAEAQVELLEPLERLKQRYDFRCLRCGHEWRTMLSSVTQSFSCRGGNSCPRCFYEKSIVAVRRANRKKIEELGYEIVGEYDEWAMDVHTKILVRRIECGHVFDPKINNLLAGKSICRECTNERRKAEFRYWNEVRKQKFLETASEWQVYSAAVGVMTRKAYRQYKKDINPQDLPLGLAGVAGAHQVDHIVPKRYCFDHGIPPEICGHQDNLQVIPWFENLSKRDQLPNEVPDILKEYMAK